MDFTTEAGMKTILIKRVPEDLHKALRHLAVEKNLSMSELLRRLIKKAALPDSKGSAPRALGAYARPVATTARRK